MAEGQHVGRDEQRLAELGYRQELTRAWSSFTNFAISFLARRLASRQQSGGKSKTASAILLSPTPVVTAVR